MKRPRFFGSFEGTACIKGILPKIVGSMYMTHANEPESDSPRRDRPWLSILWTPKAAAFYSVVGLLDSVAAQSVRGVWGGW